MNNIITKKIILTSIIGELYKISLPNNINYVEFNKIINKKCLFIKKKINELYFFNLQTEDGELITNNNFNINNYNIIIVIFFKLPIKQWL